MYIWTLTKKMSAGADELLCNQKSFTDVFSDRQNLRLRVAQCDDETIIRAGSAQVRRSLLQE